MTTGRHRALTALVVTASALLCAIPPGAAQGAAPGEYEVKAAFLYNFARYVEWPSGGDASSEDPFVIVILGEDPFGTAIDETLRGKTLGERAVVIRRAAQADDIGGCDILFIGDSEHRDLPRILDLFEGTPTLTVADMEEFAERGGVIRFRMEGARIRLDINRTAAQRAGLRVSSELLKLARIVGRPPGD
jgi:hypothetical protein